MLQIGEPGQLLIDKKIDAVISADDADAFKAANPVKSGRIVFDEKAIEKCEDALVKNLQTRSGTAVLILRSAHDLSNNVPGDVRLIEVTVRGYLKASGESKRRD